MQTVIERKQITEDSEQTEDLGRDPGTGATKYALPFIDGLSHDEAREVLRQLFRGHLHDATDKRVKRCAYCQYYWRDDSLRNTKKTCSDDCHTAKKSLQRRKQRERQAILEPDKQPQRRYTTRDDYYDFLENPYWLSEKSMFAYDTNYISDVADPVALIELIDAKNHIFGDGNRKRNTSGEGF